MNADNGASESRMCAIIGAKGTAQATGQIGKAASLGIGLVELRMDLVFGNCIPDFGLVGKAHENGRKCIVTFRDKKEGGAFHGEGKKALILRAIEAGADFVDVEIAHPETIKAVAPQAKAAGCKTIGSWHDFGTKPELTKVVEAVRKANELPVDIAKVAFAVSNEKEGKKAIAELANAAKLSGMPVVISPMGADAAKNRAYALSLGSEFAYCILEGSEGMHGVPACSELAKNLATLTGQG
ncbi:MAG: type I 3-dehydroquinate dehydratase [Candidatus Micrarchaeia archaeon]|jgi:3-dehydroquinate dehydratase type I